MMAELEQAIALCRQHGLMRVADGLAALKADVETRMGTQRAACRGESRASSGSSIDLDERGRARLAREEPPDLMRAYEVDTLGLTRRQRNALIRAGFRTITDVRLAVDQGMLRRVRNISEESAREIGEKLRGGNAKIC